jgi:hypothetical protein
MIVKITQIVEIDEAAWIAKYGLPPQADFRAVRQDIKKYFENWLRGHVKNLGLESK